MVAIPYPPLTPVSGVTEPHFRHFQITQHSNPLHWITTETRVWDALWWTDPGGWTWWKEDPGTAPTTWVGLRSPRIIPHGHRWYPAAQFPKKGQPRWLTSLRVNVLTKLLTPDLRHFHVLIPDPNPSPPPGA